MCNRIFLLFFNLDALSLSMIQIAPVLVIMTIKTQVLPVAAIGRIIIVIMVLVVNRQHMQGF